MLKLLNKITLLFLVIFSFSNQFSAQIEIVRVFPNLTFSNPVDIQNAKDGTNRIFVVEQQGKIKVFNNNSAVNTTKLFLDITTKVLFNGEQGLLGLAFHPSFKNNKFLYINYTADNPRRSVISRFQVSIHSETVNIDSELILLEVSQPYPNHNGGQLAFGPDDFLYISFGDGGSGGDPQNNGQNLSTILGSIIRIDVNSIDDNNNYSIPSDNPFINNSNNYREEIYAYGLRNVWRFSFDSAGNLWAADVGQNKWEEINLIKNVKNYGWRIMEGLHCFNPSTDCNQSNLELPVIEYDHSSSGGYSVTGGYVYEGNKINSLIGKYVYADFANGNIWSYNLENNKNLFLIKHDGNISTFGIDENKNIYFADYGKGHIFTLIEDNVNSIDKNNIGYNKLFQNFPNPFNPTTTISYKVASNNNSGAWVKLDIFNIIGENIATIVNKHQTDGLYKIKFNSKDLNYKRTYLSSGIYFYRLSLDKYFDTKKMTILN